MTGDIVILGAGPAGLTAAYQLSKEGLPTTIVERDEVVGGLSRTVRHHRFSLDIGGHRFFTKSPEVRAIWHELLGDDLLPTPRLSRIYYRNRYFHYPLRPIEALGALGLRDSVQVVLSYLKAMSLPHRRAENFEQWVASRFGWKLYSIFFKTYTEKVWGIPCSEIGSDWAAQRIETPSLLDLLRTALLPHAAEDQTRRLDLQFEYPRLGPGQMWERCRDLVENRGHRVLTRREIVRIVHAAGHVRAVVVRDSGGREEEMPATHVISSIALPEALQSLSPAPPCAVLAAARRLRYRDFLTVALVIARPDLFPDTWLYIHSADVRLGRIQNYRNWSPAMVPDPGKTCLGLEYFVWEGNDLWTMADEQLLELGARELEQLRLASRRDVVDGVVVRMRMAYPVYDSQSPDALRTIRSYLGTLRGLQQVGRNGQHRYNNQDHSMLTAMLAVRNVLGESEDVWDVNAAPEYHETMERAQPRQLGSSSPNPPASRRPRVTTP